MNSRCDKDSIKVHFPARLYQIIEDEDKEIIHWEPDGKSFRISNNKRFKREIIPKYFPHGNFASIQRQLNLYGFLCLDRIHLKGVFFHPSFIRGEYEIARTIRRKKTWKTKKDDPTSGNQSTSEQCDSKGEDEADEEDENCEIQVSTKSEATNHTPFNTIVLESANASAYVSIDQLVSNSEFDDFDTDFGLPLELFLNADGQAKLDDMASIFDTGYEFGDYMEHLPNPPPSNPKCDFDGF